MPASEDRYRNYRFRLQESGRYVAGFAKTSALPDKTTGTVQWRSGRPRPCIGPEGQGTPFFISLEHGASFDRGFEQWVSMVRCYGPATGKGSLLPEYQRPLTLEGYDENGKVLYAYRLSHCWVTEYKAFPGPDTSADEIRIEHLQLGFGGWVRDPP
jgi:phage tail-like protein